jgi:hypothetical protein
VTIYDVGLTDGRTLRIHWTSLLIAVLLLGVAGFIVAEPKSDQSLFGLAAVIATGALVVWLIGKALRYILTGPLAAPAAPVAPKAANSVAAQRTSSVPSVGRPTKGPWG